jgi:hypothetical protein
MEEKMRVTIHDEPKVLDQVLLKLNSSNKTKYRKCPRRRCGGYNCWGFTAAMLRWTSKLLWLSDNDMEFYLAKHTKPVKRPQTGDIAVFRQEDGFAELLHTAIVTNGKTRELIHKPGAQPLEYIKLTELYRWHREYGRKVEYRRPVTVN